MEVKEESVNKRHDELGQTGADVGPTGGDAVGEADDGRGEHGGHPELVGDEVGEGEAEEEARED